MQLAGNNTRNRRQKISASAGKNTRNWQKNAQYSLKKPAIAGNTPMIPRVKSPENCWLDCILHIKLAANCVLSYEWSRLLCVRFLPRRCRGIYLFLQVNCIRCLFTCVSPHVKFPIFTGIATMSKQLSLAPRKLKWKTPLHKK